MSELLLDSLGIKGYRCFEYLTIEKLGRVNLIVGKNNVGKTALLEALWLYANSGQQSLLFEIVRDRDEIPPYQQSHQIVQPWSSQGLRNLFYNRPNPQYLSGDYPKEFDNELQLRIGEMIDIAGDELKPVDRVLQIELIRPNSNDPDGIPNIQIFPKYYKRIENYYIKATGINNEKLIEFWDIVTLTPMEDKVINALELTLPKLNRIDFIGYPNGSKNRVPVVRVSDQKERLPLKSFGEGTTRLLGLSLALVQCQDGMLFIDEIETGLHYSILTDVWRLIFRTARDLNVQVFATTHSKDCIEAFAEAANDSPEDGILIRLEKHSNKIIAKTIEEEMLVDAVNYEVEVR